MTENNVKPGDIRNATILFCDIRGSSVLADSTNLVEYDKIISEFHERMKEALDRELKTDKNVEWSVRGDEACLIMYTGDDAADVQCAIRAAVAMIRNWYESKINKQRISEKKNLIYIGCGIHHGPVVVRKHPAARGKKNAEGYSINLAKRVESQTKDARYSKIMVSLPVYDHVVRPKARSAHQQREHVEFTEPMLKHLAGIAEPVYIFEIKSFGGLEHESDAAREQFADSLVNENNLGAFLNAVETSPSVWTCSALGNFYYFSSLSAPGNKKKALLEQAIKYFERTLMIEPGHGPSRYNLALCLMRQGRHLLALEQLDHALRSDPL
ncbi:MAG: adenylate/guanylate cyclase domain-containing protein, partial [bacterium]